jgi:hypothetical protein
MDQPGAPQGDFGFRTPRRKRKPARGRPRKVGAGIPHARRHVDRRCPLHVVEAEDAVALGRALQSLAIRVAKGLNRLMGTKGAVFSDRYHARTLRTPTEVRNVLVYVLNNARKHVIALGVRLGPTWHDPYSSAEWFTGWTTAAPPRYGPAPVAAPATWFLQAGYLRAGGAIRADEAPRT